MYVRIYIPYIYACIDAQYKLQLIRYVEQCEFVFARAAATTAAAQQQHINDYFGVLMCTATGENRIIFFVQHKVRYVDIAAVVVVVATVI